MGPRHENCDDHNDMVADRAAMTEAVKNLCERFDRHLTSNEELMPKLYEMIASVKQLHEDIARVRAEHTRLEERITNEKKVTEDRISKLEWSLAKIAAGLLVAGAAGGAGSQVFKALAATVGGP